MGEEEGTIQEASGVHLRFESQHPLISWNLVEGKTLHRSSSCTTKATLLNPAQEATYKDLLSVTEENKWTVGGYKVRFFY